jgi:hypothetical protein
LRDRNVADEYVEAVGHRDGGRYTVSTEELLWLLTTGRKRGAAELELLKALQHALPQPDDDDCALGRLKGLLTNAIIMRTRVGEREGDLASLLEQAVGEGHLGSVALDEEAVRRAAELMAEGGARVHGPASS